VLLFLLGGALALSVLADFMGYLPSGLVACESDLFVPVWGESEDCPDGECVLDCGAIAGGSWECHVYWGSA